MELASKAMQEGHEVFFLICEADLKTCFINPEHKMPDCFACQSKIKTGIRFLNIPNKNILRLSQFKTGNLNAEYSFSSVSELKKFNYKGSDIGLAVASSIISSIRDHKFDTITYKDEIAKGVNTAIMVHEIGEQVLQSINPDVVIMFNGRFLEYRPMMRLCEKKGIDFYTHERGGKTDRYNLRKNSTPHAISVVKTEIDDLWLNSGDEKYTIGKNFFLDRRNKVVQSWKVYTDEQKVGLLPEGFDVSKKNICFFNSSMDEYEGIPDHNNQLYEDDNAGIERICQSFLGNENYHFYLRVHPNLKGLDNAQNKTIAGLGAKFNNLTIIKADETIDTYALMDAVDLVVTFGSTMGIEALFWNKPSLLLGRAFYESLEGIIQPGNHEEAIRYISNIPVVLSNDSAVKYGYWCISFGTKYSYFKSDGLFSGEFMGKRIGPSLISKIKGKVNRVLNGD
jgi:hypothetical protein